MSPQRQNNEVTASTILHNFACQTTLHGVPKVIVARSAVGRCIWAVICLAAGLIFVAEVYEVLRRFLSYPKKVTIEVVAIPVPFPAVSVCNMRNLDFHVLNTIDMKFRMDEHPKNHLDAKEGPFIRDYMRTVAKYGPLWYDYQNEPSYRGIFQEVFSRTTFSANIPEDVIKSAAVQLEEFFVTCFFGGNRCNMTTDFITFFDSYYYNCFTYTAPPVTGDDLLSLSEGVESGWSAVVLTGNGMLHWNAVDDPRVLPGLQESRSAVAASEGVRVVIHPPDTQPFPFAEGYDVPPGYSASFGVRPRRNERVGQPHGNCSKYNPFDPVNDTQNGSPQDGLCPPKATCPEQKPVAAAANRTRYRAISCQKMCLQQHVIDNCLCYDTSLPLLPKERSCRQYSTPNATQSSNSSEMPEDAEMDANAENRCVKPCRLNDEFPDSCMYNATDDCKRALMALYDRIECARRTRDAVTRNTTVMAQCGCHPPCEEFQYDVSYSLSKWPATGFEGENAYYDIFYVENFRERFGNLTPEKNATIWTYFSDENRQNSMKDFARLNVYIADSSVVVTKETADFEFNQLVSDIGGQLGIWVGISVITLSEVVELIYLLLRHSLSASRRFSGQSSTTVPSMPSSAVGGGSDTAWGNSSKKSSANAGKGTRGPANARCHSADEILNGKCSGSDYAVSRRQTMAATAAAAAAAGGKECCGVVLLGVGSKSRQVDEQVVIEEELSWIEYDRRYRPNEYMTYARHSGTAAGSSNAAPDGSALSGSGSGFTYEPIERDRSAMYRSYFSESSVS